MLANRVIRQVDICFINPQPQDIFFMPRPRRRRYGRIRACQISLECFFLRHLTSVNTTFEVSLVASNSLVNAIIYSATTTRTSMGSSSSSIFFRRVLSYNIPFATTAIPNPTVTSELPKTEASFTHLDWLLAVGPP